MLLAIDIGNTNIVIGVIHDDEIVFKARIASLPLLYRLCSTPCIPASVR